MRFTFKLKSNGTIVDSITFDSNLGKDCHKIMSYFSSDSISLVRPKGSPSFFSSKQTSEIKQIPKKLRGNISIFNKLILAEIDTIEIDIDFFYDYSGEFLLTNKQMIETENTRSIELFRKLFNTWTNWGLQPNTMEINISRKKRNNSLHDDLNQPIGITQTVFFGNCVSIFNIARKLKLTIDFVSSDLTSIFKEIDFSSCDMLKVNLPKVFYSPTWHNYKNYNAEKDVTILKMLGRLQITSSTQVQILTRYDTWSHNPSDGILGCELIEIERMTKNNYEQIINVFLPLLEKKYLIPSFILNCSKIDATLAKQLIKGIPNWHKNQPLLIFTGHHTAVETCQSKPCGQCINCIITDISILEKMPEIIFISQFSGRQLVTPQKNKMFKFDQWFKTTIEGLFLISEMPSKSTFRYKDEFGWHEKESYMAKDGYYFIIEKEQNPKLFYMKDRQVELLTIPDVIECNELLSFVKNNRIPKNTYGDDGAFLEMLNFEQLSKFLEIINSNTEHSVDREYEDDDHTAASEYSGEDSESEETATTASWHSGEDSESEEDEKRMNYVI